MDKREAIGIRDASFELTTVGDLVKRGVLERPIDGNHGEIHPKSADFVSEGVPFVMASDLKNGRVEYGQCAFITERQAESLRKGFAKNGDVLLTHKATIGETAIVAYDKHPYIMLTPQVTYYRVKDKAALSNRYLKAYFDSSLFQQTLQMLASSGSTRAYLGITEQHRLPVILPPHEKQEKIAAILGTIDDLIANNQRRITLLESMAEEIYREWFVRMRFPRHAEVQKPKGIPEGWTPATLGTIANFVMGQSPSSEHYNETGDGLPFHQGVGTYGDRFPRHQVFCSSTGRKASAGDILFSVRAPVGRLNIADTELIIGRGLAAMRHKQDLNSYLFYLLKVTFANEDMIGNGSIFNSVGKDELAKHPILCPPPELAEMFETFVKPIDAQLATLYATTTKLSKQRDALLPRLISGKLGVHALDIQFPPSMQQPPAEATQREAIVL
ncbi:restriction endonuclease subunit S [Stenotrophomonas riyadhensis]|jgi:type I restriction enzyme S subunit